jgi:hypothetical protein
MKLKIQIAVLPTLLPCRSMANSPHSGDFYRRINGIAENGGILKIRLLVCLFLLSNICLCLFLRCLCHRKIVILSPFPKQITENS